MRLGFTPSTGLAAHLNANSIKLSRSIERLSSGLRINKASDDPAMLGYSNQIAGQIGGYRMVNESLQDGLSMLQVRAAAMETVGDMVQRIRDLAVRAANDATLTNTDRQKMQDEAGVIINTINMISDGTLFNGKKVFDVSFDTVPAGYMGNFNHPGKKAMSVDLKSYADANGGVVTILTSWFNGSAAFPDANLLSPDGTEAFGYLYATYAQPGVEAYVGGGGAQTVSNPPTAAMNSASSIQYSGWNGYTAAGGYDEESFTITNPAAGMWTIIIDNESASERNYGIFINEPSQDPTPHDTILVTPDYTSDDDDDFHLGIFEVTSLALGVSSSLNTVANARTTLSSLDGAITTLAKRQTTDMAKMNIIEKMLMENERQIAALSNMNSQIKDADMAVEIAALTATQVVSTGAASLITADTNRLTSAVNSLLGSLQEARPF